MGIRNLGKPFRARQILNMKLAITSVNLCLEQQMGFLKKFRSRSIMKQVLILLGIMLTHLFEVPNDDAMI